MTQILKCFVSGLVLLILCGAALGQAQTPSNSDGTGGYRGSTENLFLTTKPDVTVVISKHATGADMVQITILSADYSSALLQDQIARMGTELNVAPRGVSIFAKSIPSPSHNLHFLTATFAVDGLISTQGLNLQAIARAFCLNSTPAQAQADSSVKPESRVVDVLFDGYQADQGTLLRFSSDNSGSPAVTLLGQAIGNPPAVEYRLKETTGDPTKISIPMRVDPTPLPSTNSGRKTAPPFLLVGLGLVAAIIVGILVYTSSITRSQRTGIDKKTVKS